MPEIAEVEIVRRGLEALVGWRIAAVEVVDAAKLGDLPAAALSGQRVRGARRHGKLLGLELDSGDVLAFHLRMTGNLLLHDDPKARLRLVLRHGRQERVVSLVDPRRFGTVVLTRPEAFQGQLGPDLWDKGLTGNVLAARAGRSRRPLKAVLLDQEVLAGVGNYMVDETLWAAKLSPTRPATSLTPADWARILKEARRVAGKALRRGGASFSDYRQTDGSSGRMQEAFRAYGRAGLPCRTCGRPLEKTVVAGRGTTYCPECQV